MLIFKINNFVCAMIVNSHFFLFLFFFFLSPPVFVGNSRTGSATGSSAPSPSPSSSNRMTVHTDRDQQFGQHCCQVEPQYPNFHTHRTNGVLLKKYSYQLCYLPGHVIANLDSYRIRRMRLCMHLYV